MSSDRNISIPLGFSIPTFESIQKHDGADVYGYGHLLVSAFQYCGGFDYGCKKTDDIVKSQSLITIEARKWVKHIRHQYENLGEEWLFDLSSLYSFVYGIAFKIACADHVVETLRERFFNAWLRGYRRISDLDLAEYLVRVWNKDKEDMKSSRKNCMWRIIRPWIDEFRIYGRFENKDLYSAIRIASILIWCDLPAVLKDEIVFKKNLIARYMPQINLLEGRDGKVLKALYGLTNMAIPKYLGVNEYISERTKLMKALAKSPDINRYDRLAFELDFKYWLQTMSEEEIQLNTSK